MPQLRDHLLSLLQAARASASSSATGRRGVDVHRCGYAARPSVPGTFARLGDAEVAQVNLPVAVLIWLMIVPMLLKIDFHALAGTRQHWKGIGVALFVNWAIKSFSMALLGWIFIRHVFAAYLAAAQLDSYIAGLLATVVGVLIEVPVMLSVVRIVNRSRRWYEARA